MRPDGRQPDQLRPFTFERHVAKFAEGSCLLKIGDTHMLVTATVEDRVPPFMKGKGSGWVTAEYSMLPRSGRQRNQRELLKPNGRSMEIQRLIGRSMRTIVDLESMGERTITIDCDAIQADGGTRCAAITAGYVAAYEAVLRLFMEREIAPSIVAMPRAQYAMPGRVATMRHLAQAAGSGNDWKAANRIYGNFAARIRRELDLRHEGFAIWTIG